MEKIGVKIKKLHPESKTPIHASIKAAGFDLYSVSEENIKPNEIKIVQTGIALEIPSGWYVRIEDRSGMAVKGIYKLAGIIDSDYRGEIKVVLRNSSDKEYKIERGDRIAQGILTQVSQADFEEVNELSETQRSDGGFHSTGIK
jgi:dUTP pyrophosphatase